MEEKEIYTNSILTFVFTNDGQMVVRKDKNGKLDTLPQIFYGYRKKDSTTDYEDSIWVINHPDEYKERVASFFVYHLRNVRDVFLNNFFKAKGNRLLDVGTLNKKIANSQIEEMKNSYEPSYIRVNNELYDGGQNEHDQQIIHSIETRYVVLPSDDDIELFPELEAIEVEELRKQYALLSSRVTLGVTGKDGEIMNKFINQLKSLNKSVSPKK